ncbi:MAG TPA: NADH-quinone oxidoreductase subunit J [Candidatus Hypogeohydataceae bacterium YC38]|nr:NADH-quinone oxidoreductase subunit J [Candidatus Brocadiales bacterium]
MELIQFYIVAAITISSAVSVIMQGRVMYSILSLIVTLLSVAWIYAILNASFLAVVQVILYAGAIVVLFVFAVMMLRYEEIEPQRMRTGLIGCLGLLVALFFIFELILSSATGPFVEEATLSADFGSIKSVGAILYTQYLVPLELASILLLVAVVGAALFSKRG